MITEKDIEAYFTYHAPTAGQCLQYQAIRDSAKVFANTLIRMTPQSADQTYALRLLRMCVMTANQAIALEEYEQTKKETK